MCAPEPRVTAGAGLAVCAVIGSGFGLYVVAGTALNAFVWMFLTGWAAIASILLLRRHANPVRQAAQAPARRVPQRVHAQILASRPMPALEAARPAIDHTVTRQRLTAP